MFTSPGQWPILPYWLFFTALLSMLDFFKCYTVNCKNHLNAIYPRVPWQETSALGARQLGVVHALLILIRIHAGMDIAHPGTYRVCHLSFLVVLLHYAWERFGTGTIGMRSLSATEVVALVTFWWMFLAEGFYVYGRPFGGAGSSDLIHPQFAGQGPAHFQPG